MTLKKSIVMEKKLKIKLEQLAIKHGFSFKLFYCEAPHVWGDIQVRVVKPSKIYDGMQILFENDTFEVSEYMAGINQDELHIYTVTKSLAVAVKSYLKGNLGRNIIKRY